MSKSSVDSLQKRHVLFQGPHPRPREQICKQCAGQINLFFGSSVPTVRKIPSQCQPQQVYTEMQPPSSPLTSWFFPCFGGECRQLVGADLCSLTCWSCKRIPLDLCQETYWSDTCSRAPAATFCFGTSLLWARGSWAQCTGGMHRQALLPPPPAPSCSSQPKPWRAQEQEQSLLHGAGTSAVWWDVTRQAQSFQELESCTLAPPTQ